MKFKLEANPHGAVICHILEPLTKSEAAQILQGIVKLLTNGKSRIVMDLSAAAAAAGEAGADFLEASLRQQQELARKLGGDIKFVVPGKTPDLEATLNLMLGRSDTLVDDQAKLQAEVARLKEMNEALSKKVQELLQIARNPVTPKELQDAAAHFRALAKERELGEAAEKK